MPSSSVCPAPRDTGTNCPVMTAFRIVKGARTRIAPPRNVAAFVKYRVRPNKRGNRHTRKGASSKAFARSQHESETKQPAKKSDTKERVLRKNASSSNAASNGRTAIVSGRRSIELY